MGRRSKGHRQLRQIILLDEDGNEQAHYEIDSNGHLKTKLEIISRSPGKPRKIETPKKSKAVQYPKPHVLPKISTLSSQNSHNFSKFDSKSIKEEKVNFNKINEIELSVNSESPMQKQTTQVSIPAKVYPKLSPVNKLFTEINFSTGGLFTTSPFFKPISA